MSSYKINIHEVYDKTTAAWIAKNRPLGIADKEWDARMSTTLGELAPKAQSLKLNEHNIAIFAAAMILKQYVKREYNDKIMLR